MNAFRFVLAVAVSSLFLSLSAAGQQWTVDPEASDITVAGTHAGNPFVLTVGDYELDIRFDPANPQAGDIHAVLDMTTAASGNMLYDRTLPEDDWLSTQAHPHINFQSESIEAADGGFMVHGMMTVKGAPYPVSFPFTLTDADGRTVANAEFDIDRITLAIGIEADKDAKWVSQMLTVSLKLVATPTP